MKMALTKMMGSYWDTMIWMESLMAVLAGLHLEEMIMMVIDSLKALMKEL